MALKFVVICAFLAAAHASDLAGFVVANPSVDAIGATQQNVVRSFGGTVSQYSKAVDTPYSSVRKSDTRINNNVYTPTYAKTLAYAAPAQTLSYAAPAQTLSYAAPAQTLSYAAPAHALSYAAPAQTLSYAAPAQTLSYAAPAQVLKYAAPAPVVKYAGPAVYSQQVSPVVYAQPAAKTLVDPTLSAYSSKTISYSPAAAVAHVTFDGFGAHYGY